MVFPARSLKRSSVIRMVGKWKSREGIARRRTISTVKRAKMTPHAASTIFAGREVPTAGGLDRMPEPVMREQVRHADLRAPHRGDEAWGASFRRLRHARGYLLV